MEEVSRFEKLWKAIAEADTPARDQALREIFPTPLEFLEVINEETRED